MQWRTSSLVATWRDVQRVSSAPGSPGANERVPMISPALTHDSHLDSDTIIDALCEGCEPPSPGRRESLTLAIAAGANQATLIQLRNAERLSRNPTIVLPPLRYENLSRGRGWCRRGRGDSATWGERESGGYRVGPGRWTVGATDGFSRRDSADWTVAHVLVGPETWTVAS